MSIEKLRELVRWAKDNGGMREWALADDCFEWALHIESNGVAQTDECSKLRARVAELERRLDTASDTRDMIQEQAHTASDELSCAHGHNEAALALLQHIGIETHGSVTRGIEDLAKRFATVRSELNSDREMYLEARKSLEQQVAAAVTAEAQAVKRADELEARLAGANENATCWAALGKIEGLLGISGSPRVITAARAIEKLKADLTAAKADAARLREEVANGVTRIRRAVTQAETAAELEAFDALSATDSTDWLAKHDAEVRADMEKAIEAQAESVRMYAAKVEALEAQLAAATNDAARAELRARDLRSFVENAPQSSCASGECSECSACVLAVPDSDARLREVMRRVAHKVQQRSLGTVLTESELVEVVEKELRGATQKR